ncbi:MAG TPA: VCBS repeat-containing protein, partial [Polyangium sp.]|nr:VCBS repeat-containing protein [Polyangium sp.]
SSSQCPSGRYGFPSFSHANFAPTPANVVTNMPAAADMNGDGFADLLFLDGIVFNEGSGRFGRKILYEIGAGNPVPADVDGDGDMDLVVKSGAADTLVGVLRNLGNGTFGASEYVAVGPGARPRVVTDLNNDNHPDIVATTNYNNVWIFLNQGNGTFGTGTSYQFATQAQSDRIGEMFGVDVEHDGDTDIVFKLRDILSNSIVTLVNQGNGTFGLRSTIPGITKIPAIPAKVRNGSSPVELAATPYPEYFAPGDFNGDGYVDFVYLDQFCGTTITLGNNLGTQPVNFQSACGAAYSTSIGVADLNGDGKDDLFSAGFDGSDPPVGGAITVALQTGDLTFDPARRYEAGSAPRMPIAADFDNDGKEDAAFWDVRAQTVVPLRSDGLGGFDIHQKIPTGAGSHTLGDVNGDGLDDLISTSKTTYAVEVWINQGAGTFTTKTTYPTLGITTSPTLEDLDGNGTLDLLVAVDKFTTVFLNSGNGTFVHNADYLSLNRVVSFELRDVNGDNKVDLLIGEDGQLDVRLSSGNGTFGSTTSYMAPGANGQILAMDVNDDGFVDMVTATCDQPLPARGIWLNQGNGTFVRGANFAMPGANPSYIYLGGWSGGDLNGDGRRDIVILNNGLFVGLNNGDQTFSTTQIATLQMQGSCAIGDVTRDGRVDAICSHVWPYNVGTTNQSSEVDIFPGRGDGTFDPPEKYSGGYYARTRIGDLDGDGVKDIVTSGEKQMAVMLNKCLP